jgi:DNA mismatch repair protein MutS
MAERPAAPAEPSSPMVAQYERLKAAHRDALLFFRMGDFYELFFADAVAAASALDIALTRRGRHRGEEIPMCGVPAHNAEPYLQRLIRRGFKVAICEQLEDPAEARKRGGKSLVHRDVVRVVTPGTITEDALLDARAGNFLLAMARSQDSYGLAWLDLSTGELATGPTTLVALAADLDRIAPREVLLPESWLADEAENAPWRALPERLSPLAASSFDSVAGERRLCEAYGVRALDAFGAFSRAELGAAGALVEYVRLTQKGLVPRLGRPRRVEPDTLLQIDPATRRSLELTQGAGGGRQGSLLEAIDRTVTGAGGRLLAERLASPLAEAAAIRRRLDEVECLAVAPDLREALRHDLRRVPDLQRALSRIALARGGPRDLLAIGDGLERAAALREAIEAAGILAPIAGRIADQTALARRLRATLVDSPPVLARDGGLARAGVLPELDELRELRDRSRRHVAALEARYRDETSIPTLKVRHNNLIGYHIEVTSAHLAKVPPTFVQRQSMAGATRYATPELAELESRIASAADRALALELELFETLRQAVLAEAEPIADTAAALAELDVAAALAELAVAEGYVRPRIEESTAFVIEGGRHPVVEQALRRQGQAFVANDCALADDGRLWLLTGPNMAGKSTFLRQNALIVVMAQMGGFVPAAEAGIGVVDRLFSRVGAADDLARGRSTFMVEMVETATILHQAGPRSLVVLDEIGRGTATYDGMSLAWAIVEHLHEVNRCRGLFATHFHELTALAARLDALACHTMRVKEWQGEVVFLHEVAPGTADRSYGVHVARLAGLPEAVLARAEEVLQRLEEGEPSAAPARLADDLPLFAAALSRAAASAPAPAGPSPVETLLAASRPDELSPREALDLVYRLKAMLPVRDTDAHGRRCGGVIAPL